jgi:hypothetical protein
MLPFRVACVAYWILLSVLLLAPDPFALLGVTRPPGPPGGRGVHFLFFTLLALLAHASRWPMRLGVLAGVLVAYAFLTEGLQALIPHRTVELLDLVENLLGLAAGTAIWRLVGDRVTRRRRGRRHVAGGDGEHPPS